MGYAKPLLFQKLMKTRNTVFIFGSGYMLTVIAIFTVYPRITVAFFATVDDADYSAIMIVHSVIAAGLYLFMLLSYVLALLLVIKRAEKTTGSSNPHWKVLMSVLVYCTPPNIFVAVTLSAYFCDTIIEAGGYLRPSHWSTPDGVMQWARHNDFCAPLRPWSTNFTSIRLMINALAALIAFHDYRKAVKRGLYWLVTPAFKVLKIPVPSTDSTLFERSTKLPFTRKTATTTL
ncbi:hypothetical protein QR680_015947 [Steinernema hermaphroditum]|uniref:Uncharacterized protein n=1 Tax=Steinernema hermaphroditum TaxID=289476 RepID=A0AA39H9I2_9BILA|nr:hypothetical protein QR680_015947 [Steinernema hermaphroditum]